MSVHEEDHDTVFVTKGESRAACRGCGHVRLRVVEAAALAGNGRAPDKVPGCFYPRIEQKKCLRWIFDRFNFSRPGGWTAVHFICRVILLERVGAKILNVRSTDTENRLSRLSGTKENGADYGRVAVRFRGYVGMKRLRPVGVRLSVYHVPSGAGINALIISRIEAYG